MILSKFKYSKQFLICYIMIQLFFVWGVILFWQGVVIYVDECFLMLGCLFCGKCNYIYGKIVNDYIVLRF